MRVSTDGAKLPVNYFGGIDVGLSSKDLRDLVSEDLCHKRLLMSPSRTSPTIQICVSIDKITESHGFATGVRHELQLFLHKIEDCSEL